jgi:putative Mg2+ transporter-C (MgtC) family protein
VIGILVGVGFYLAAMGLAFFSAMIMIYLNRVEPAAVAPCGGGHAALQAEALCRAKMRCAQALERGYEIAGGSLTIGSDNGCQEWRFVALALSRHKRRAAVLAGHELAPSKAWTASSSRTPATKTRQLKQSTP